MLRIVIKIREGEEEEEEGEEGGEGEENIYRHMQGLKPHPITFPSLPHSLPLYSQVLTTID